MWCPLVGFRQQQPLQQVEPSHITPLLRTCIRHARQRASESTWGRFCAAFSVQCPFNSASLLNRYHVTSPLSHANNQGGLGRPVRLISGSRDVSNNVSLFSCMTFFLSIVPLKSFEVPNQIHASAHPTIIRLVVRVLPHLKTSEALALMRAGVKDA